MHQKPSTQTSGIQPQQEYMVTFILHFYTLCLWNSTVNNQQHSQLSRHPNNVSEAEELLDSCQSAHFIHLPVGAVRRLQVFCRDNIQRQNSIHGSFIYLCFISYTPWKRQEGDQLKLNLKHRKILFSQGSLQTMRLTSNSEWKWQNSVFPLHPSQKPLLTANSHKDDRI